MVCATRKDGLCNEPCLTLKFNGRSYMVLGGKMYGDPKVKWGRTFCINSYLFPLSGLVSLCIVILATVNFFGKADRWGFWFSSFSPSFLAMMSWSSFLSLMAIFASLNVNGF